MKQFLVIAKIDDNPDGSAKCIKHHVNDLIKYTAFLDATYPGWRWFNVFDRKTRSQVANFTNKARPTSKWLK